MISLSLKSFPVSSGQNAGGIVPLGLNMMINRCRGRAGLARPRLGRPRRNGSAAVEMPTCWRNWRRWMAFIVSQAVWMLAPNHALVHANSRGDNAGGKLGAVVPKRRILGLIKNTESK